MDPSTRNWYLQQMGIPVWEPRSQASQATQEAEQKPSESVSAEIAQAEQPAAVKPSASASPEQAGGSEAVERPAAPASADPELGSSDANATLWLVMPNVAADQQAAAEALLDKILAAVEVPKNRCQLIWGLPEAMPTAEIKWVWCFGIQPPPGLQASTLNLPPLSDMLVNVEAKKQAWGLLKNQMPFL